MRFQSVSGQWLQVENSAGYVNEPNPFTLASRQPKTRIAMLSSSPFSVDFFPESGVPPKPSEKLLRLSPGQPRALRDAEHRERESTEHQGRDAEHQGREPAEHHGPQHDVDEQGRVPPGLEQDELEAYVANSVAQQLQEIDRRDALPRSQPDGPPSAEEVAAHNLTHVPFRRWCEGCVATRSRGDAQSAGANRETRVPVVRIDFYFTSLDDHARPAGQGEQDTCCLNGVDFETKMVLSAPGPNKGAVIPGRRGSHQAHHLFARQGGHHPAIRRAAHQGGQGRVASAAPRPWEPEQWRSRADGEAAWDLCHAEPKAGTFAVGAGAWSFREQCDAGRAADPLRVGPWRRFSGPTR